ncbi:MAG: GNAT family N-acetyltransferase [Alphaproteobacteria bacterium]
MFVDGQDVPLDRELDGLDDNATHWLMTYDGQPCGTARARALPDGVVKIERVAVLADMQGKGFGALLMHKVLTDCASLWPDGRPKLSAQVDVIPFYQRLGFVAYGPVYQDAGIDHRDMKLDQVLDQS